MEPDRCLLVTGATGFVGSHLVERLRVGGAKVRALVRPTSAVTRLRELGVDLVEGSLEDSAALRRAVEGTDGVLHLAAATKARSREEYRRVNRGGTAALVRAAVAVRDRPRRFVYLSSMAAAGPSRDRPVRPEDPPRPLTTYGATKLAGEEALLEVGGALESVILRPPTVYGPRDRDLLIYFRLANRGILPVPTGPERKIQLIFVDDLVEAILRAMDAPGASGIYHVADPQPYAWRELPTRIAAALGRRGVKVPVPGALVALAAAVVEKTAGAAGRATIFNREKARELLAPGWLCDTERARDELGFEAATALADGLGRTAEWYRRHDWL